MAWWGGIKVSTDRSLPRHVTVYQRRAEGILRGMADAFQGASGHASSTYALTRAAETAIDAARPAWMKWHRQAYYVVGAAYAAKGVPPKKKRPKRSAEDDAAWSQDPSWWMENVRPRLPDDPWWTTWLNATLAYAERQGLRNVRDMDEATRRLVQRQITDGIEARESVAQIRDRIDAALRNDYTSVRAERIARTEVPTAARAGTYHAASSSGVVKTKSWLDSGDDHVRQEHADATTENSDVPFTDPFKVRSPRTGAIQELMFPGDTSRGADASNVVNCRCDVLLGTG